jgi:hypothetical protein
MIAPAAVACKRGSGFTSKPSIATPRQQPPDYQPKRRGANPRSKRAKMNKARALRTDLERTNRRHSHPASTACALCFGTTILARCTFIRRTCPSATRSSAATRAEAVGDLRDRDHGRVALLHRLTVHMADAQVPLKQFGNRPKWGWTRHDDLEEE